MLQAKKSSIEGQKAQLNGTDALSAKMPTTATTTEPFTPLMTTYAPVREHTHTGTPSIQQLKSEWPITFAQQIQHYALWCGAHPTYSHTHILRCGISQIECALYNTFHGIEFLVLRAGAERLRWKMNWKKNNVAARIDRGFIIYSPTLHGTIRFVSIEKRCTELMSAAILQFNCWATATIILTFFSFSFFSIQGDKEWTP